MSRIATVDPAAAEGQARTLLGRVERALGSTPNMMRAMANSPAVLDAYLQFSGALAKGRLPARVQEQIALVAAVENECGYCLAAHTVLGARAGLSQDDLVAGRSGQASDPKVEAALTFAKAVIASKGFVTDADLEKVRAAGYGDGEIGEIVAAVALNTFTNYFNSVGQTTLDFPAVEGVRLRD
ncbi:carboxymuconolactone decarboxylase family protein [Actinoplanes sp. NPDC049596]|uniref:carboxymuconolactone decarboxylase family protein n=1 Tax=unclassified Actinoplanes TaxID=2626549 RepID=UPI003435D253